MTLSESDREWVRLLARDTAFKVFDESIKQRFKWIAVGFILSPILGGGAAGLIFKMFGS